VKTQKELETEAILNLISQLADLQKKLDEANERIRILEAQVYNGSTK
jgi:hypothetical protein